MSSIEHIGESPPQNAIEEMELHLPGWLMKEGFFLLGFSINYQVVGWAMTVRVRDAEGRKFVSFGGGRTVTQTFKRLLKEVTSGAVKWHPDKYQAGDLTKAMAKSKITTGKGG